MIREGLRKDINPRPGKPEDLVTAVPAATFPDAEPDPVEKSGAGFVGGEPGHDRAGTEEKREPKRFSEFEGGSRGSRTDQPPVPLAALEEERKKREQFEKIQKEFDENEEKIWTGRERIKGKWNTIQKALSTIGLSRKEVEDDEIKEYMRKRDNLRDNLITAGRRALRGKWEELEIFENDYAIGNIVLRSKHKEEDLRSKGLVGKALVGFANVGKNFREFIAKQSRNKEGKITAKGVAKGAAIGVGTSVALATTLGAALPALGIAALGISAGAVSAWTMRFFGAVGAGYSAKKSMEKGFIEETKKKIAEKVIKKIELMKEMTDKEWEAFVKDRGGEGGKSINETEQDFAEVDIGHKQKALGIAGTTIVTSALLSYFGGPYARRLLSWAWGEVTHLWGGVTHSFDGGNTGFYDAHGPIAITEAPAGAGKGAMIPGQKHGPIVPGYEQEEHWEFTGGTAKVGEGGSVWRSTRDIFMQNFDEYGYDDNQAKRLFGSFKDQGILKRLGIKGADFDSLSDDQKHKIWAEWKTATAIKAQGIGNIVVHPGDSITLDADGHILLGETSGIKAGHIHDVPRAGGAGQVVAEASAPGGAGRAVADNHPRGASTYETTGKRSALDQALDNRQKMAQENYAKKAAISAQTHEALVQSRGPLIANRIAETAAIDNTQTHKWMDFIQERIYGKGTTVDWREPASEFRKRMLGSFLTSDQPMGPPANVGEQQQYWRAAQELNRKLGPTFGNESTESWLQRGLAQGKVTPEEIVRTLKRVVNA